MKNRLIKEGKWTSLFGVLIIVAAITSWFIGKTDATEALLIAGFGSGFLAIKDKHIGL